MVADFLRDGGVEHLLEGLDKHLAATLLVAPLEVAEPNAGEIFHPLKIGDGDAAGVEVGVRDDDSSHFSENLIGGIGDRAVGRLGDERGLDFGGVLAGDDAFHRGGDEDVALGLEHRCAVFGVVRAGESLHAAVGDDVLLDGFDVEAVGRTDRAVALDDAGDLRAVLLAEKLGGVVADVAEALHDDAFALECAVEFGAGDVVGVAEEFAQAVLHAAACGLDASADAAEVHRLAGDAAHAVCLAGEQGLVRVGDPSHLAFAGAHVGCGHVEARVDEVALGQFLCKPAGDFLEIFFTVLPWVDLERALGAAEGDHHDGALVRHQRRQRLNLVLVGEIGVADAALDRQDVFAVDGAPAGEHLIAVSQLDAELHLINRVAASDLLGEAKRQIHGGGGAVEHPVDTFAEGDFVGVVHHGVAGLAVATEAKRFETPL